MSSYTLDRYYNGRLVSKRPPKMQRHHSLRSDYIKPREYHREHLFLEAGVSKKKNENFRFIYMLYYIHVYHINWSKSFFVVENFQFILCTTTILTGVNNLLKFQIYILCILIYNVCGRYTTDARCGIPVIMFFFFLLLFFILLLSHFM